MTWSVSPDPTAFDEAVLWFLLRTPMSRQQWNELSAAAKRKAFTVSHVARADVLVDVFKALDRALANGQTLADFRIEAGSRLREAWQGSVKNPAWRMETIYRTNLQMAYSSGRWQQMTEPGLAKLRPFGKFDAIMDNRVTEQCEKLDGTVLEWEVWEKRGWVPPLHFNCRSSLRSLRKSQADKEAKRVAPDGVSAQEGFGAAPGASEWQPDLAKYPPSLRDELKERLASAPGGVPEPMPRSARGPSSEGAPDPPWWTDAEPRPAGKLILRNGRVLTSREAEVAEILVTEGNDVEVAAPPSDPTKRWADLVIGGAYVETKRLRGASSATVKNAVNDSLRRGGQARNIILDARGTGLSLAEARRGLARLRGTRAGRLDWVRIMGDDFDITEDQF